LSQVLWTRHFMESQGYPMHTTKLHQDNMSTILLSKNGKASSGKRTRHIDIRYFFIADRVENKEIEVIYCPTGDMHADLLTKPLQGCVFKRFRDSIMNIQEDASVQPAVTMMHRSVLRNCAPTHNKNMHDRRNMHYRRNVLKVHWKQPLCHTRLIQPQPVNNINRWNDNWLTAAAGRAAEGKTFRTRL